MRRGSPTRWVKIYFRNKDKVMRAIPNLEALVVDDVLVKVYTLSPRALIYEVKDE